MKRISLRKYCQMIETVEKRSFKTKADRYRYIKKRYPRLTVDQIAKMEDLMSNKHPGYRYNIKCALTRKSKT